MIVDIFSRENFYQNNQLIKQLFALPEKQEARVFHGLTSAVYEICHGLGVFYSHKKNVLFIKGQTGCYDFLIPQFYKMAYVVREEDYRSFSYEELPSDNLFVVFSEDHPVTGEKYPQTIELEKALNEKKIFSIIISHKNYQYQSRAISPYTIRICSIDSRMSVALCGERVKSFSLLSEFTNWKAFNPATIKKELQEQPDKVKKFEFEMMPIAPPYFKNETQRIYDRAVIIFNDVSAEAIISHLEIDSTNQHLLKTDISTTNGCYWNDQKLFRGWWKPEPSETALRGMLIISIDAIEALPQLHEMIKMAYQKVQEKQKWS